MVKKSSNMIGTNKVWICLEILKRILSITLYADEIKTVCTVCR